MALSTPRELFVHELSDTLSAEHIVLTMLGELAQESENAEVRKAFERHQQETEQQIKNLEKVFDLLGERPEQTTCYAAKGLKQEHDALKQEQPAPQVREVANLAGAFKTEHYEFASYTMLVRMARSLGEREALDLLQENLDQEKEMARLVESLAKDLGQEVQAELRELEKAEKEVAKRS